MKKSAIVLTFFCLTQTILAQEYAYLMADLNSSLSSGVSITNTNASLGVSADFDLKENVRAGIGFLYEADYYGKDREDTSIEISPGTMNASLTLVAPDASQKNKFMLTTLGYSRTGAKIIEGRGRGAKGGISILSITANPVKLIPRQNNKWGVMGVSFSTFIPFGKLKNSRGEATIKPDVGLLLLPTAGIINLDKETQLVFTALVSAGATWSSETSLDFVAGISANIHFY
ncbi:MAG: hypothetical protein HQ506_03615 [Candidatus Marinimicrobia bacterium]|nr:hypothetical protein [Candidatus Neomarinimicrobiota bacterium]